MKILFIGDISGKPGRSAVKALLPKIVERYKVDFVIANGENAAGGFGITEEVAKELYGFGINIITSGNHIWDKRDIIPYMEKDDRLLRPLNFSEGVPGYGSAILGGAGPHQVGVINLSGRVYMGLLMDDPFRVGMRAVEKMREKTNIIVVDFHAEATSEKIAMGYFLDGKVSAVIGTHTHVQTADEKILPEGTAFITDVGMTGPIDSIIGVKKEQVIERFLYQMPYKFEIPGGPVLFCGAVMDVDEKSGHCHSITRLQLTFP